MFFPIRTQKQFVRKFLLKLLSKFSFSVATFSKQALNYSLGSILYKNIKHKKKMHCYKNNDFYVFFLSTIYLDL